MIDFAAKAEDMRSLLALILHSLVDHPDALRIEVQEINSSVALRVHAADTDIGKLIGAQGRMAKSIRTCLLAAATKKGVRCTLEIVENKLPDVKTLSPARTAPENSTPILALRRLGNRGILGEVRG